LHTFRVNRDLPEGRYRLREVFSGLENAESLRKCIDNSGILKKILRETYVMLTPETGYMYINDKDGSLIVSLDYLRTADEHYLYLDVIHELVHIKQFFDGKNLFDEAFSYVERPTEIEAYRVAVDEARKMGMSEEAIADYLYVEWVTRKEYKQLLKTLGVNSGS